MSNLNVALLAIPNPIKQKLADLSASIDFDKASDKGANGYTFFGKNQVHNRRVAVKFYNWGGDPQYHAEPRNLAAIRSDHVISILDAAFVDNEYAYFVTPFYPKGDMEDLIAKGGVLGNRHAVQLTREVLSGLVELHCLRLLHCDLKPQNVLIDNQGRALIGDFGSVKALPHGTEAVPGSGHSLIYRPPESIATNQYGLRGDLYQVGILLFQLLGGYLPYDEIAWLTKREKREYLAIQNDIDRSIFATRTISSKIQRGRVIDVNTLPPWICKPLRRTVTKACNITPDRRFTSTAEFLAHLARLAPRIHDWQMVQALPTLVGNTSYRIYIRSDRQDLHVEKRIGSGWRRDNSFTAGDISVLVQEIEGRAMR